VGKQWQTPYEHETFISKLERGEQIKIGAKPGKTHNYAVVKHGYVLWKMSMNPG